MSFLSIRYPARHRLTTPFAFGLLVYDVLQLAGLLYFTGGIENPFSVLLVAPVTVAAATLPPRYTIFARRHGRSLPAMLLISYHYPLPWYDGLRFELPRDYKIGALVALIASMAFMAFFTWRLNKEARQMSAALAATDMVLASEQRLHALDGLLRRQRTNSARRFRRSCSSRKNLSTNLVHESRYRDDLQLLHSQAKRCREILQKLTRKPDEQDPMHASISVVELLEEASAATSSSRQAHHHFSRARFRASMMRQDRARRPPPAGRHLRSRQSDRERRQLCGVGGASHGALERVARRSSRSRRRSGLRSRNDGQHRRAVRHLAPL